MDKHTSDYRRMKRLSWQPTYVDQDDIYPPAVSQGIYFKDWDQWEDPFHLSYRQYVEVQAKKEQGFHPTREAFDRYGGLDRIDQRWMEGAKVLYPYLLTGEYGANRVHARGSRYAPAPALRSALFYQSFDELRHSQNHIYQLKMLNRYADGYHNWAQWRNDHFLLRPAKFTFEDILSCDNVFEPIMALNFVVEVAYTNLIFVGIPSQGVLNGDTAFAAEMLTTQSDETRHMAIGMSTVRTLLEADERNLEPLQYWFDKWFWINHRTLAGPASLFPDYFASNKAMAFKDMYQRYVVDNFLAGLVDDLGEFGLKPPRFLDQALAEIPDYSHSLFRTAYQYKHALFNKVFQPDQEDKDFFGEHYPNWEERHGRFWKDVAEGDRKDLPVLPMFCQLCQLPCVYPTPEAPSLRSSEFRGTVYWFCSDGCKWIFDNEPVRYSKALTIDREFTGKEIPELREAWGLEGKLGGDLADEVVK